MNIQEMQQTYPVGSWIAYRTTAVEWADAIVGQVCGYREVTMNDFEHTRVMCADVRSHEEGHMIQARQVVGRFDPVSFCREHGLSEYYSPMDKAKIRVEAEPVQAPLF